MSRTVLSFGEVLWDLLPDGAVLGGAPGNFAYRVNSLGDRALMVSRLGRDTLGDRAWDLLGELGMDRTFIQRDDHLPTGTVTITMDEDRNHDFVIHPDVAYDAIESTDGLLGAATEADCLCFGTLVQRGAKSRETLRRLLVATRPREGTTGCLKVLDINFRKDCYSPDVVRSSLGWADVLKLNDDEVVELSGMLGLPRTGIPEFCDRILGNEALGTKALHCCVVTLGSRGSFARAVEGPATYVPGYEVELVDSCGSGDAFTAGFVHLMLRDRPLEECCRLGNALGALVASQAGATVPISWDDVVQLGKSGRPRVKEPGLESFRAEQEGDFPWKE